MESPEQLRRRSSSFNPKAANFNPAASAFEPSQPSTSASADDNSTGALSSPVSVETTAADSPSQHAEALRRTFPNVVFPHLQSAPLQYLIPRSNVPVHSWANDLENHAMNLGLPIAPSQSNQMTTNNAQGEDCFGPNAAVNPLDNPFSRSDTPVQEGEGTSLLFSLVTRAQGLDGNLVQQALTRTLTAEDLAKHLEGNMFARDRLEASPHTTASTSDVSDETVTPVQRAAAYDRGILRPPPGLVMPQHPQINMELYNLQPMTPEEQIFTPPAAPRAMMDPSGPLYGTPQTFPTHLSHHTRVPSYDQPHSSPRFAARGRRVSGRGRFVARPKRSDQGPMPSSADIYPEDAVSPSRHYDAGMYGEQFRGTRKPQPPLMLPANLRVEDSSAWPTPAEAKADKPTAGAPAFDTVAQSVKSHPPSDTHDPEQSVGEDYPDRSCTSPEANVSMPSPATLVNRAAASSLLPDVRPLTPGQMDGSRYGLRWFGIGYSDNWEPPVTKHGNPIPSEALNAEVLGGWNVHEFRVRPRLHGGWGGWEWAAGSGWCVDD